MRSLEILESLNLIQLIRRGGTQDSECSLLDLKKSPPVWELHSTGSEPVRGTLPYRGTAPRGSSIAHSDAKEFRSKSTIRDIRPRNLTRLDCGIFFC